MMKEREKRLELLTQADPHWASENGRVGVVMVFECPIHDHYLSVPLRHPLDGGPALTNWFPSGATWEMTGDRNDFSTLTFAPSIHVEGGEKGCEWHGFIQNGRFVHCGDSR